MGDKSKIEWTDATWNPVRGCSKVSDGCRNCYAMSVAYRFSGAGQPYEGLAHKVGGKPEWTNKVRCVEGMLDAPTRWRKPRRIFVNSMSDLFHPGVDDGFIWHMFAVMAACPQHQFQVLTKRPQRMRALLNDPEIEYEVGSRIGLYSFSYDMTWPLPNVWLGVSAEDQATANERIPLLLGTPAAVRWISAEPLLGQINLRDMPLPYGGRLDALEGINTAHQYRYVTKLDWVVVGGESGPGARPMHPDWARRIRDDCQYAFVPFFFKQWGTWQPAWGTATHLLYNDGRIVEDTHDHPDAWRTKIAQPMQRVGKKAAGRLLDGREWNEYPESAKAVEL